MDLEDLQRKVEDDTLENKEVDVSENKTSVVNPEYVRMILAEKVRIVLTQTGYDEKTAIGILQKNNWDCSDAIKKYMKEGKRPTTDEDVDQNKSKSVNQKIYTEIRKLMDEASMSYYREKERKEELQRYVEQITKDRNEEQEDKKGEVVTENNGSKVNEPK